MTETPVDVDVGAGARCEISVSAAEPGHDGSRTPNQYEQLKAKLERAASEFECGDTIGRSEYLEAASAIVFDLLYSLDFKRGGELVPRLAALYGYIGNELLSV